MIPIFKGLHNKQPSCTVSRPDAGASSTDGKGLQIKQLAHMVTSSDSDVGASNADGMLTVKQEITMSTLSSTPAAIITPSPPGGPQGTEVATTSTDTSVSIPAPEPSTITMQIKPDSLTTTPISLKLVKMNVKPGDRIQVMKEMLDCIPTSKYGKCTRELIDAEIIPEIPHNEESLKENSEENDSDTMVIYWRKDDPDRPEKRCK